MSSAYPRHSARTVFDNQLTDPIPLLIPQQNAQPLPFSSQMRQMPLSNNNPQAQQQRNIPSEYSLYKGNPDYNRRSPSGRSTRNFIPPNSYNDRSKYPIADSRYPNDPNRQYDPNDGFDSVIDPNYAQPSSWWSQQVCCGLSRLSALILFITMIIIGLGALGGLIVCAVLYANDSNTDFQWKILGMVVCSVMLLTILVAFLIFLICYQTGRIAGTKKHDDLYGTNRSDPYDGRQTVFREQEPYTYPVQYRQNPIPTGTQNNQTPLPTYSNHPRTYEFRPNIDEKSLAQRPRALNNGIWPYGAAQTPAIPYYGNQFPTKSVLPNPQTSLLQSESQQAPVSTQMPNGLPFNNQMARTLGPPTGTRIEYFNDDRAQRVIEKRTRRFIEHPEYDIVEEIIERPRPKLVKQYVDLIEEPLQKPVIVTTLPNATAQPRYQNVLVQPVHVPPDKQLEQNFNDFSHDHFYQ